VANLEGYGAGVESNVLIKKEKKKGDVSEWTL